jgi:O-antigen/teichoic acid export membrane protein
VILDRLRARLAGGSGSLVGRTVVLSLGRGSSQFLALVAIVITARYYSPADFGEVGVVMSIAQFLAMLASFRFENMALVSPAGAARDAYFRLAYLSVAASTVLGLAVIAGIVLVFPDNPHHGLLWWIVPAIPLISLGTVVLPAQLVAMGAAGRASLALAAFGVVSAVLQVATLIRPGVGLLLGARVLGYAVAVAVCLGPVLHFIRSTPWRARPPRALLSAAYPELVFGSQTQIVNTLLFQLPIYAAAAMGYAADAGAYWLAFNLFIAPYIVISGSFRALFQNVLLTQRENNADMHAFFRRATLLAIPVAAISTALNMILIPIFIDIALGPEWHTAVVLGLMMSVLLFALIVQTPVVAASTALGIQKAEFWHNVGQLSAGAAGFLAVLAGGGDFIWAFAGYAGGRFVVCLLFVVYVLARLKQQRPDAISTG